MLIPRLQKWVTTPVERTFSSQMVFWFSLSLTFATMYAIPGLKRAFSSEYVIQDDARQHVFWTLRFLDPELFANDLIADYYQLAAPLGYTTFYRIFAQVGIDPIVVSKLLPIVLGLITTGYCFCLCLEMFPVPSAGFISTMLLNQILWGNAALVNATPRAFFYAFILAFLYYLLRRSLWLCLIAIALQGLFYPPSLLITAGILVLQLICWDRRLPFLSRDRMTLLLCGLGLGLIFIILLPYLLDTSEFGPTISLAEARQLPEFAEYGRNNFFTDNLWVFWFQSHRSAFITWPLEPPAIYGALLLPILPIAWHKFSLVRHIRPNITLLIQILVVSVGLFTLAHLWLFKLYLPTRYMMTLKIVLSLSAGIGWVILLDGVLWAIQHKDKITQKDVGLFFSLYVLLLTYYYMESQLYPGGKKLFLLLLLFGITMTVLCLNIDFIVNRAQAKDKYYFRREMLALAGSIVLIGAIALYPSISRSIPQNHYNFGRFPQLYEFLANQPKDSLIASLSKQADYLPTFAKRSVLVAREYALAYQVGYYSKIRERASDLINAQYSLDPEQVNTFIQKYGVDFWLLDRDAFTPMYIANSKSTQSNWIRQFQPAATEALERLEQGKMPILARVMDRCGVVQTEKLVLVNTECILKVSRDTTN